MRFGAAVVVVTGKDWVKLKSLPSMATRQRRVEFCVAELELRFPGGDRTALIDHVRAAAAK